MITQDSNDLTQPILWKGRLLWLRRLRADDANRYAAFRAFLDLVRSEHLLNVALPDAEQIAGRHPGGGDIVFAAIESEDDGGAVLGIARALCSADGNTAEIAIVVRPDVEGQGLGRLLMGKLVNHCRDHGPRELVGHSRSDNRRMIELARAFRFVEGTSAMPESVSLRLRLQQDPKKE